MLIGFNVELSFIVYAADFQSGRWLNLFLGVSSLHWGIGVEYKRDKHKSFEKCF